MALELGMAAMPWNPLGSGLLSSKWTRRTGEVDTRWAGIVGEPGEREWRVIDALNAVAAELGAAPAAVALAWVRSQPAFASTLIDARRLSQFRENLAGLDVQLSDAHLSALDAASTPTLNFPAANNHLFAPMLGFGGMTVDGETPPAYPALAASSARY
jgi:aryl-alcohol dehydrogenase-like predicted oxidoreductase